MRRLAHKLAALACLLPMTAGAQFMSYVDSSTYDRLQGAFDLSVGDSSAGIDADLKLVGEGGETRFQPRITANWAPMPFMAVRTVVKTGDLNSRSSSTSVDTQIALRPSLKFVDRVETAFARSGNRSTDTFKFSSRRFDTGLDMFGGESLRVRADMQHVRTGERATTSSNLTSTLGLGSALNVTSVLKFDDKASAGVERSSIDTRLDYRMPFEAVRRIETEFHQGVDGQRQSLAVLFSDWSAKTARGTSYSVSGKALVREIDRPGSIESRRIGFETRFSGIFPSPVGGKNSLSLQVERGLGSEEMRTATLSYDHEWAPNPHSSVALELRSRRRNDTINPTLDVNWTSRF